MKKLRIAINGFGRIGRSAFKIAMNNKNLEIVAINDLTDNKTLAHLLKYDSVQGKFNSEVKFNKQNIIINKKSFPIFSEKDPLNLPWGKLKVDIVLECTGIFRTKELANLHLKAGAKKVIISAPAKSDNVQGIVLGVNEEKINKKINIYDAASCTTNCIAPVMKLLIDNFGIEKAFMTTTHAYTSDQRLQDSPHKDLRRSRAASINIIPTTTGAALATAKIIPKLKNRFDGMAIRVPVINGSLADITIETKKKISIEKVKELFKKASKSKKLANILEIAEDEIVSSDIIGNSHSAIIDLNLTKVLQEKMLKIIVWYDNEWAYSNRLIELCEKIK